MATVKTLRITWGTSRGRDTYGYTTAVLRDEHGRKRASCNGGGYDMRGTVFGHWLASEYADRLRALRPEDTPEQWRDHGRGFYGLTFHDPNYDPGKAVVGQDCADRTLGDGAAGVTVEQAEAAGQSLGLERCQAFYRASSPHATARYTVPSIDGACGMESVRRIAEALGLQVSVIDAGKRLDVITVTDTREGGA